MRLFGSQCDRHRSHQVGESKKTGNSSESFVRLRKLGNAMGECVGPDPNRLPGPVVFRISSAYVSRRSRQQVESRNAGGWACFRGGRSLLQQEKKKKKEIISNFFPVRQVGEDE